MTSRPANYGSARVTRRRTAPGSEPGTLITDPRALKPRINVLAFGSDDLHEEQNVDPSRIGAIVEQFPVTWVDVQGLGDADVIRTLGSVFDLHGLALEDVINVHQRPKVEEFDDHLFLVARMPNTREGIHIEQLTIFLGSNFVLSFQEHYGNCFDPIRKRVKHGRGRLRKAGADYLAYALLDAAIDAYFPLLESFGEMVEDMENRVVTSPTAVPVDLIHGVRRHLLTLRRAIYPLRDMANVLLRDESPFITAQTRIYLRDCYDHTVQLMDMVETYREVASGLVELYLSSLSHRMNEIMKILTIIATIFIPLGFIAGLYGMNFDGTVSPWNMPELGWYLGYPFALGLMFVVALGLLLFFWRKRWIGVRAKATQYGRRR
jgi:magnesium transporter